MDYLEYYQLAEHPFSNVVESRFFYDNPQQSEAITKLKYAVDSKKGLAVVIGNIGAGKTTLARRLLEELDEENYEAALLVIIHSSVSSDWLLKKFSIQLGVMQGDYGRVQGVAQHGESRGQNGQLCILRTS
ncbi:MAG: AAA family ATPase [Candidatus Sulfobium sp.]